MSIQLHYLFDRSVTRRHVLRVGSAAIGGLSLAQALQADAAPGVEAASPRAKNVIMVFLSGGASTIDMWDMKPEAPAAIRGEFRPRETAVPGISICEHMPRLAAVMNLASLVRSVAHTIAEHTQGTAYLMTGNRPNPATEYPSLGSLSANLLESSDGVPPYMTFGSLPSSGAGDVGAAFNPLSIATAGERPGERAGERIGLPEGFSVADLDRRQRVLEKLDQRMREFDTTEFPRQLIRFQQQALDILRSDKINKALALEHESAAVRERYGLSPFGRNALAARRLIEAGARFVTIGMGDWDTHANNFTRLQNLLPQLDQGLAALIGDLHDRRLLDETIVYCTGEFGRTPGVNSAAGRDHWARSMTALLAGGGFRRGIVYGATDEDGSEPTRDACSPDDLSASIFRQLGFEPTRTVTNRSGRPMALFRNGRALDDLV